MPSKIRRFLLLAALALPLAAHAGSAPFDQAAFDKAVAAGSPVIVNFHAACTQDQAAAVHGVHLVGVAVDQPDLVASLGQHATEGAAQSASAQNANLQSCLLNWLL